MFACKRGWELIVVIPNIPSLGTGYVFILIGV